MMKENPKVTIIIPAYNVEKYIFRAIESSVKQTYKNIEIIIIDDGSTDGTLKEIKKYASIDDRVIYVHQSNKGVATARNEGLQVSTGAYVLFLDSDDWLEPNAVEQLIYKKILYPQFLIASDFNHVCEDKNQLKYRKNEEIYYEKVLNKNEAMKSIFYTQYHVGSSCYKLYDAKIINDNRICFPDGITHGEDGVFVFKYLSNCDGIFFFAEQLWNIFDRPDSVTSIYNISWVTSIKAVDMMRDYNKSELLVEPLEAYKVARTMMVLNAFVCAEENDKKTYDYLKKLIKGNGKIYCKYYRGIKKKIVYFVNAYLPPRCLRGIVAILSMKNKIGRKYD